MARKRRIKPAAWRARRMAKSWRRKRHKMAKAWLHINETLGVASAKAARREARHGATVVA